MDYSVTMNRAHMHRSEQEFSTWNSIPVSRTHVEEYSLHFTKYPHNRKPCDIETLRVTGNSGENTRIITKS